MVDPRLLEHLDSLGICLEIYLLRWVLTFFAVDLGVEYAKQVVDCYLYESSGALVRVSLTILALLKKTLLCCESIESANEVLSNCQEFLKVK